jgi:hypothetical protein
MNLSIDEIRDLISHTDVFRNDCERNIRRIRRNRDVILNRHEIMPDDFEHPDSEIQYYKDRKAKAVIIKKKLLLQLKGVK